MDTTFYIVSIINKCKGYFIDFEKTSSIINDLNRKTKLEKEILPELIIHKNNDVYYFNI